LQPVAGSVASCSQFLGSRLIASAIYVRHRAANDRDGDQEESSCGSSQAEPRMLVLSGGRWRAASTFVSW
jgi:hypothetical protein